MLRFFSCVAFAVALFCMSPSLKADSLTHDYGFQQERMVVDHGEIFLISTFDSQDVISNYNFNGQRLWEARFHAKILSWSVQPNILLVFSKDRNGHKTYITCIDRYTGQCLWQRP